MAEVFVAFHQNRFVIPCVLDRTPLPQFLGNAAYLDRRRDGNRLGLELCRSVMTAPDHANEVAPLIASRTSVVQSLINGVAAGQYGVLEAVVRDRKKAAKVNTSVNRALQSLKKLAALDSMVLNLAGYQCKNTYMIKHWEETQAGRAPKDPLLIHGERYFFDTLSINPADESAINGIGAILFYERELEAAAFFQRRAVDLAKRRGGDYEAAQEDLRQTLRFLKTHAGE